MCLFGSRQIARFAVKAGSQQCQFVIIILRGSTISAALSSKTQHKSRQHIAAARCSHTGVASIVAIYPPIRGGHYGMMSFEEECHTMLLCKVGRSDIFPATEPLIFQRMGCQDGIRREQREKRVGMHRNEVKRISIENHTSGAYGAGQQRFQRT